MAIYYVENGRIKANVEDVYELGINCPDLLIRWLVTVGGATRYSPWPVSTSVVWNELFQLLSDNGMRAIRFAPFGGRPLTYRMAFMQNQAAFLGAFDSLVTCAERYDMSLIPSLFFSTYQIPPLFEERLPALAVSGTASYNEFERLISVIVPRYRGSKAIGCWEFGNEYDLRMGQTNVPGWPLDEPMGTPVGGWTEADAVDTNYCNTLTNRFQQLVRSHDSAIVGQAQGPRMISSGLHGRRADTDPGNTWIQTIGERVFDDLTETFTAHTYDYNRWYAQDYEPMAAYLLMMRGEMEQRSKPMIVGEFGVPTNFAFGSSAIQVFTNILDYLDTAGVQLALLWNTAANAGTDANYDTHPRNSARALFWQQFQQHALARRLLGSAGRKAKDIQFGSPIVFAGDSLTGQGWTINATTLTSTLSNFAAQGLMLARQPFALQTWSNAGVTGDTATQLLARYNAEVIAHNPKEVCLLIGTNNLGGSVPQVTNSITEMLAANKAIGAHTTLIKLLPRGTIADPMSAPGIEDWEEINTFLALLASSDVSIVDAESALGNVDANHTIQESMTLDGIHLSPKGAATLGAVLGQHWSALSGNMLLPDDNSFFNLVPNGFMVGSGGLVTGGTGQSTPSWGSDATSGGGATAVFSKVARTDGFGSWQQIAVSGTYTGNSRRVICTRSINISGKLAAGSLMRCAMEVESNASPQGILSYLMLFKTNVPNSVYTYFYPAQNAFSGVICSTPFVLGTTPTSINVELHVELINTAGTDPVAAVLRFGRVEVRNLSSTAVPPIRAQREILDYDRKTGRLRGRRLVNA